MDIAAVVDGVRKRQPRALARAISAVEDGTDAVRDLMQAVAPHAGHAHVIGLTGSPGVGKSTTTSALISHYRGLDLNVAVLACDPTSPFSGGAILGDRVRMQDHFLDPGVYIRSMASRGHLGGLSATTPQAARLLDAAGFDIILIETVGVGQSEVEVAAAADTTVVLLAPGMGDGIQATKAGILEVGDVFVVNKADRDGAHETVRELRHALSLAADVRTRPADPDEWTQPILLTVASTGQGIAELADALATHRQWLTTTEPGRARASLRAAAELEAVVLATLRARARALRADPRFAGLAAEVAGGSRDAYSAAEVLLSERD
ncbi:MAG: methylmalonyl Co-A mutase-associated GTPase MeaB [Actinomycetales bacterium]|nr:methylmalonyl Co-A mutase-associated GTPase MeaB [Actinomycetales bacterium]